jgi:hypothetical protein
MEKLIENPKNSMRTPRSRPICTQDIPEPHQMTLNQSEQSSWRLLEKMADFWLLWCAHNSEIDQTKTLFTIANCVHLTHTSHYTDRLLCPRIHCKEGITLSLTPLCSASCPIAVDNPTVVPVAFVSL